MDDNIPSLDLTLDIKRIARKFADSSYGWAITVDGQLQEHGTNCESIKHCLIEATMGITEKAARIDVIYRGRPTGSYSIADCQNLPENVAYHIAEMFSEIVAYPF